MNTSNHERPPDPADDGRADQLQDDRLYRQFFEAAPDAVFLLSADDEDAGRILDANTLAATMHGYTRDELLRMHIRDLDDPEDAARVPERVAQLKASGKLHFEATHVRRDGSEFPVEITARYATVGGRQCIVTFNRDISERHRYEYELAHNRMQLEVAARASRVGFWEWDLSNDAVQFSPEWKAQIGYGPDELDDDFEEWRRRVHPDDLERALAAVKDHIDGRTETYETQFRFRHRDGSYRWIYVRGEVVRDGDGKAVRFFGCHVDVTAQREAEEQRLELARRMGTLQRLEAIGTLASGIAHDFNNILNIIAGNVEIALMETDDPEQVESITEIKKAGERAGSLVRQILAFSRGETPQRRRVRVADPVREAVRLVRSTTPQRIAVDSEVADGLPVVAADAEQLHQVFVNLGTNAWHAIGDGDGRVTFRVRPGPLPPHVGDADMIRVAGDYAVVEIHDDGCGIPPETRERIFEPFFTTKDPGTGTGLGLALVYSIVEEHYGQITIDSPVDQTTRRGNRFTITLPYYSMSGNGAPA
ncbi:MAG: PAS domain S-box protein [Planctomycetes bacterium]|nr:PAS domain S-box protein [Planctomycetota bacterium]